MDKYFVMLTKLGEAKFAQAVITKTVIDMDKICLGDGLGKEVVPVKNQTALVREVWRGSITKITVDPINPNWAIVEATVPSEVGGWTAREVGIVDKAGDLIVVGNYPSTFKPIAAAGADKTLQIKLTLKFVNPENVKCVTVYQKDEFNSIELHIQGAIFKQGVVEIVPGNGIAITADQATGLVRISSQLQDWAPNTEYKLKEFVYYNKILYRCTTAHTSSALMDDDLAIGQNKWEVITTGGSGGGGKNPQPIDPTAVYYYDIAGSCFGKPDAGVEVMRFVAVRPFVIPQGFTDSQGCANSGPFGEVSFLLFINNRQFGKMKFPASQVGLPSYAAFESDEDTYFAVRDILTIISPEEQDVQMEDIEWTLVSKLVSTI